MPLWRFFFVVASLTVFADMTAAEFAHILGFEVEMASNLHVVCCNTCLHFTCDGLEVASARTLVSLPSIVAKGATTSFYIHVNDISGSDDVQFTVFQDAVLRWTEDGSVATWGILVDGEFTPIGDSVIVSGSGRHSVTIARSVQHLTVVEDGKSIGVSAEVSPPKRTTLAPTYHLMLDGIGANLNMHVSDIQVHPGFGSRAAAETVV